MENLEQKVKEALEYIRPSLQNDGGDIEFVRLEGNKVYVKLKGACAGCMMAQMTLKNGVFLLALLFVSFMNLVNAQQGKWAGTVKYQLSWTGDISEGAQLPTEWETKVFENKTKTMSFTWAMMLGLPATELTDAVKKTITYTFDLSMIPIDELNGKWFIRKKIADADFADISYKETGNTKEIAGKKVKEIICTSKDKDGADVTETIWACDEIGPMTDLIHLWKNGMNREDRN